MREIKFRGKRVDTGEWVYGNYGKFSNLPLKEIYLIESYYGEKNEVDHKTVGQYTGLKDKSGVEIYEGDKVKRLGKTCDNNTYVDVYEVVYSAPMFKMKAIQCHVFKKGAVIYLPDDVEVIGNIHDK